MAGKATLAAERPGELWPATASVGQLWLAAASCGPLWPAMPGYGLLLVGCGGLQLAVGKLRPVAASGRGRGWCWMDAAVGNGAPVARCGVATPKEKQGAAFLQGV